MATISSGSPVKMSAKDQITWFQQDLERRLRGSSTEKTAVIKAAIHEAAERARGSSVGQPSAICRAIQEAETDIREYDRHEAEAAAAQEESSSSLTYAGRIISATADTISKSAVGGEELPNFCEEEEAKADAAAAVQPLIGLLRGLLSSEMQQSTHLQGSSDAGPQAGQEAEGNARRLREAQMQDLQGKTGDILYPSAGATEPEGPQPGDSSWNSKPAEF